MRKPIFGSCSWYDFHRERVQKAIGDVERLPRGVFSSPHLATHAERIIETHTLKVAELEQPTGGKERVLSNAGEPGIPRLVKKKFIDVTVPFTGSEQSFTLSISNCNMIAREYRIERHALILTLDDDDKLQDNVDDFMRRASENLELLRAAEKQHQPQLREAVLAAGERMKEKLAAEVERDSKARFKIERK
jgi:hypothetical protein